MEPQNPREVPGVAPGASAIEIRAAYTSILNRIREGWIIPGSGTNTTRRCPCRIQGTHRNTGIPQGFVTPTCPE